MYDGFKFDMRNKFSKISQIYKLIFCLSNAFKGFSSSTFFTSSFFSFLPMLFHLKIHLFYLFLSYLAIHLIFPKMNKLIYLIIIYN